MELEEILKEYARLKQLGPLGLNSLGQCNLLINDNYLITFEKSLDKEGFYIYSNLVTIPTGREADLFLLALKGNLFGKETGHAHIGYAEEARALILFEYFDTQNLSYSHFSQRFERFVQYLFYWLVKLQSAITQAPSTPSFEKRESHLPDKKIFYA